MEQGAAKKKILIIDDEIALAQIYQQALETQNYEVRHSEDGEAGLQAAKDFHPDLILVDIMMPRLSGLEFLDLFRNTPEAGNPVIIVMSAISDPETVAKAQALGAKDYFVKSNTSLEEVMQRVAAHLSGGAADLNPAELGGQPV